MKDKKKKMQMGGVTDPAMKTDMSYTPKKPMGMMYGGMAAQKPKKMQAGGRVYAPKSAKDSPVKKAKGGTVSRKPART